ncbi:MAG TPA: HAD-IA family hydrolase [Vicinamibacteria bacterium]|jgi:HAD superfamily hydrolase (TIGR01549 family)|nr:HAD-IA family hydrolase [Vicinamibacteria bacterium]
MTTPTAIIWDFDGTLADTRRRNYNVVRRLIAETTGRALDSIPALASPEIYDQVNRRYFNWRELYAQEFGFNEDETDRLGRLWAAYQLKDDTPTEIFEGIGEVLVGLRQAKHGIVSQNARDQIARTLAGARLAEHFRVIVGYDEVDIKRQKPEPDGLLACLKQLNELAPGRALYVGDHETDVRCARNAQQALAASGLAVEVVSVAACFGGHAGPGAWTQQPDYVAWSPHQVVEIARQLGF